ncbi:MAG: hypothetical protein HY653_01820 [Acidobacteria bacterium]|nr:hypothetical protein [Acidobacteriota bacterium]
MKRPAKRFHTVTPSLSRGLFFNKQIPRFARNDSVVLAGWGSLGTGH